MKKYNIHDRKKPASRSVSTKSPKLLIFGGAAIALGVISAIGAIYLSKQGISPTSMPSPSDLSNYLDGARNVTDHTRTGSGGPLSEVLQNDSTISIIKFGPMLFAGYKWFDYFSSFEPNKAFTAMITPAIATFLALIATFLALRFQDILGWFAL